MTSDPWLRFFERAKRLDTGPVISGVRCLVIALSEPTSRRVTEYPSISVNGKHVPAHRWAYSEFIGPIPPGLVACHHCDNPRCVEPAHLYPGTRSENGYDIYKRERSASAFLNPEKVLAIRAAEHVETSRVTARRFGITPGAVRHVQRRKTWPWVPEADPNPNDWRGLSTTLLDRVAKQAKRERVTAREWIEAAIARALEREAG